MSVTLPSSRPVAAPAPAQQRLFPLAWKPVLLIAGALAAVLIATSHRYGYFTDELYFLAAGDQLSWGYADQPPLVPLIARIMDALFPGSLVALRLPSALVAAAGAVLVALLTREFGGDHRAQALSSGAWAVAGQTVGAGHLLATPSFDVFLWTLITWLLVRWVRTTDDRLLLGAGVVTAITFQIKTLIPIFWAVLLVVVLCTGPRRLLRRPMLWLGGAITLVTATPTVLWQARHGWPQLEMDQVVEAESGYGPLFLPIAIIGAGLVGAVLVCIGTWRLLRGPDYRPYRFLGWTALGVTAVCMAMQGRPYYVAGCYGLLIAVGAVELSARRMPGRRITTAWFAVATVAALLVLPILPTSSIQRFDVVGRGSIGWKQVTTTLVSAANKHPSQAIVTHDYWSASALRHFAPHARVYSPNRGFWYLGSPPEDARKVVYFGSRRSELLRHFETVHRVGTVDTELPSATHYEGVPIFVVEGPKRPWASLWPQLRQMELGLPAGQR